VKTNSIIYLVEANLCRCLVISVYYKYRSRSWRSREEGCYSIDWFNPTTVLWKESG